MRPKLHYSAKDFNVARKHAKDHGTKLLKYVLREAGKKVTKYYSGNKLPKHIAKRVITVETKKV